MTDGKRKEYFGQSLKCIRLRRGMTQKELAEKIGISEPALYALSRMKGASVSSPPIQGIQRGRCGIGD